jgi:hypothetical protein
MCNSPVEAGGDCHREVVGALIAVNKLETVGSSPSLAKTSSFSLLEEVLLAGVADQLGVAVQMAVRQAIVRAEQEASAASITVTATLMAGIRMVNAAFHKGQEGSVWEAIEEYAARLVGSQCARLHVRAVKEGHTLFREASTLVTPTECDVRLSLPRECCDEMLALPTHLFRDADTSDTNRHCFKSCCE